MDEEQRYCNTHSDRYKLKVFKRQKMQHSRKESKTSTLQAASFSVTIQGSSSHNATYTTQHHSFYILFTITATTRVVPKYVTPEAVTLQQKFVGVSRNARKEQLFASSSYFTHTFLSHAQTHRHTSNSVTERAFQLVCSGLPLSEK